MARPKNSKRFPLGTSSKRWQGMWVGKAIPMPVPKKVREAMKSHEAIDMTKHFLGIQFNRHIEKAEKVFNKITKKELNISDETYRIIFSHIYVSNFIEQHCDTTVSDKEFLDAPEIKKRLSNFDALKAVKLRHDPKIVRAIKSFSGLKKKKKK